MKSGPAAFSVAEPDPGGTVEVATRADLRRLRHWRNAFLGQRKDYRYYEIVERTIQPEFSYRYFIVKDARGDVRTIQPFFLLDQDMLAGIPWLAKAATRLVRGWWPSFMQLRTLMVGCAAGEGHLDRAHDLSHGRDIELLATALRQHAVQAKARLIVMKEFPAEYRSSLDCLLDRGFTRVPSYPMVGLNIDYCDFDDYMRRGIDRHTRSDLRRKFRDAASADPIAMSVVSDITPVIDDIYPLYLQVYDRAPLKFEKLTKEYFCEIGRRMPDKVRYFIWRQSGKPIAFSLSLVQGDAIYNEYLGLDYSVALELHLYFYAFRDVMSWAIANGYRRLFSTSLVYDPKLHLRFSLVPLDLYVRHTSPILNFVLKRLLPLLEPTRYDKTLRKFPNYAELKEQPDYPLASNTARSEILDQGATRSRKAA